MKETHNYKIKSQVAFQNIFHKLRQSYTISGKDFLEDVIWRKAPLPYSDTHYNLSKELDNYQPVEEREHYYEGDVLWKNDKRDINDLPLPLTFFGNVLIEGNLEISAYQMVCITGDMSIKGVLEMESDSLLFVGGKVHSFGIKLGGLGSLGQKRSSQLLDVAVVAHEILASEIILSSRNIYAQEVKTNLFLGYGESVNLDIYYTMYHDKEFIEKKVEVVLNVQQQLMSHQTEQIQMLFNEEIFIEKQEPFYPGEVAFLTLKRINTFLDKDYMPVKKEWIWK